MQPGLGARLVLLEEVCLRSDVCGSQCSKGGTAQGTQGGLGSLRAQRMHQRTTLCMRLHHWSEC